VRISDVTRRSFKYKSKVVKDAEGHTHPGREHDAIRALTIIDTDENVQGYCLEVKR